MLIIQDNKFFGRRQKHFFFFPIEVVLFVAGYYEQVRVGSRDDAESKQAKSRMVCY
jgi:hypothetical protein